MRRKIINHLISHGGKETGEKIVLKTVKELQKFSTKKTETLIKLGIIFSAPVFKMHKIINKKRKKKIREIPAIIRSKKARISLAIKFILITLKNSKSYKFYIKLKEEIALSTQKKGLATEIKNNIQKQVLLKKRFFFYYRWQ